MILGLGIEKIKISLGYFFRWENKFLKINSLSWMDIVDFNEVFIEKYLGKLGIKNNKNFNGLI